MDPTRVLPQVEMEIKEDLTLDAHHIQILDRSEKQIRNKIIFMVKILWKSSQIKEITWERESKIKKKYPVLFPNTSMN
jgi:hypothetical protein